MQDPKPQRCRSCGRIQPFEDTVCPYCGSRTKPGRGILIARLAVLITVLLVLLDGYELIRDLDLTVGLQNLFSAEDTWEAQSPEPEIAYYTWPEEEMEALSADAFWKAPELWDVEYPELTEEERAAMEDLALHLEYAADSRQEAEDYLIYAEYSEEDARAALEYCQVDWEIQALRAALEDLAYGAWTQQSLEEQLSFSGFTPEEIEFAIENCGADWEYQASIMVQEWAYYGSASRETMLYMLGDQNVDPDVAEMAVDAAGIDWDDQAVKCGKSYLEVDRFSREEMIDQLLFEGFTQEQAEYGAEELNLR